MTGRRAPLKEKSADARDLVARVRDAALKLLASQDLTRGELSARLARRHKADAIDAGLSELLELRLVDDRRTASAHARQRLEHGAARALLESELEARGVPAAVITEVLNDLLAGRDESRDALALAREKIRTAPARLAPEAILRRTFAFLLRRGFDDETARQATEAAGEEYLGRP
jgi:SOS response regulatory protein OraA/RecX